MPPGSDLEGRPFPSFDGPAFASILRSSVHRLIEEGNDMDGRRGVGIAALMGALLSGAPAVADSILLLHPTEDALVVSDPQLVDQNYGADPQLLAWANYPSFGARSYLKFDLAGLPAEPVTFARLNLFQFMGGGFSFGVDVFRVADDGWSESTLTWNHQPVLYPAASDLISQSPLTGAERGWVSFDLLANGLWDASVDQAPGDGRITLIVRVSGGEVVARLRKIGKRWSLEHVEEGRRCTGSGCDEPCASGCDPEKNASGSPSGL